jgi:hypothetical protein
MPPRRVPLAHGEARLGRRTPLAKRNPERLARLEERHFGEYGKAIAAQSCWVTGKSLVHRAHVVGKRSTGAGPEALAALHEDVHFAFDDEMLSDARFQARWGVSRADIRARAVAEYAAWLLSEEVA